MLQSLLASDTEPHSIVGDQDDSVIDAVLVINLEHRLDRWNDVSAHLANHLPGAKIQRLKAVYGKNLPDYESPRWFRRSKRPATWAGRAGCTASHRNIFRMISQNQWKNWTLVLEDDVQIVSPLSTLLLGPLSDFLKTHGDEFQFIYLGWNAPNVPISHIASLDSTYSAYKIDGALTTHAYLIHHDLALKLLTQFPSNDAGWWDWTAKHLVIDKWYHDNLKSWTSIAAISPPLAIQSESLSDITLRESTIANENNSENLLEELARATQAESIAGTVFRILNRRFNSVAQGLKSLQRKLMGFS